MSNTADFVSRGQSDDVPMNKPLGLFTAKNRSMRGAQPPQTATNNGMLVWSLNRVTSIAALSKMKSPMPFSPTASLSLFSWYMCLKNNGCDKFFKNPHGSRVYLSCRFVFAVRLVPLEHENYYHSSYIMSGQVLHFWLATHLSISGLRSPHQTKTTPGFRGMWGWFNGQSVIFLITM